MCLFWQFSCPISQSNEHKIRSHYTEERKKHFCYFCRQYAFTLKQKQLNIVTYEFVSEYQKFPIDAMQYRKRERNTTKRCMKNLIWWFYLIHTIAIFFWKMCSIKRWNRILIVFSMDFLRWLSFTIVYPRIM